MAGERVVPILPCPDLPETLAFYTALGFEVTHHQASPYAYACVQRGDIRLDVQVSKGLNPAASPHYCYVSVPDVDALHAGFEAGLLAAYGRPPRRGIPRMGSVNTLSLDRRFTVVDPGGNHLLVGQPRATLSAKRRRGTSTAPWPGRRGCRPPPVFRRW